MTPPVTRYPHSEYQMMPPKLNLSKRNYSNMTIKLQPAGINSNRKPKEQQIPEISNKMEAVQQNNRKHQMSQPTQDDMEIKRQRNINDSTMTDEKFTKKKQDFHWHSQTQTK